MQAIRRVSSLSAYKTFIAFWCKNSNFFPNYLENTPKMFRT
jgi:hypothetical protein